MNLHGAEIKRTLPILLARSGMEPPLQIAGASIGYRKRVPETLPQSRRRRRDKERGAEWRPFPCVLRCCSALPSVP